MSAIAAMLDVLFRDPHLSRAAVYHPGGAQQGREIRVVVNRPDDVVSFSDTQLVVPTIVADVRMSDAAEIAVGDSIVIGDTTYSVVGAPVADYDRLIWSVRLQ